MLDCKHLGNGLVEVWRTAGHARHDPGSAADQAHLRMHPDVEQRARMLLSSGVKPAQVAQVLSMAGTCSSGSGGGGSSRVAAGQAGDSAQPAAAASSARRSITTAKVYALRQRMQRQQGHPPAGDAQPLGAQGSTTSKVRDGGPTLVRMQSARRQQAPPATACRGAASRRWATLTALPLKAGHTAAPPSGSAQQRGQGALRRVAVILRSPEVQLAAHVDHSGALQEGPSGRASPCSC